MSNIVSPLTWDGSRLSIPRASALQDGYLSKDDFILFSGDTFVPVTSFNTRTGEVILLEDDVLAALGYVPLNKHGDTMTGPLTLSGPPSLPNHATTKAYVDASSAGLLPGTFLVSSFGASGSSLRFTGTISAGALNRLTLTGTPVPDFAIGQGILVGTSGSSGALITKVDAIAGNVITLHTAATAPMTAVNVQHDDTVAIQTAMDTVHASLTVTGAVRGGVLIFDGDFYRVNGPFGSFNSILKVPFTPTDTSHTNPVLKLIGYIPNRVLGFLGPQGESVVIHTDKIGTSFESWLLSAGLFIAGTNPGDANCTTLYIQDLTFRTYNDPQIGGLDMGMCGMPILKNVVIDVGTLSFSAPAPSHNRCGLRMPRTNITGYSCTDLVIVGGFDIGAIVSEEWIAPFIDVGHANIGIQCEAGFHMSGPARITTWQCRKSIVWTGPLTVDYTVDLETAHYPNPMTPAVGDNLYDPGNVARGEVRFFSEQSDTGTLLPCSFTGCQNLRITDLNAFTSYEPLTHITALDATTVDAATLNLAHQAFTFGANASAANTAFREVQVPNTSSLATNLLGYWKLDEVGASVVRSDARGSNNLTLYAATLSTAAGGRKGNAYDTASGGALMAGANVDLSATSYTIAGWIQPYGLDVAGSDSATIVSQGNAGTSTNDFVLQWAVSGGNAWQFVWGPAFEHNIRLVTPLDTTGTVWYFVCARYDLATTTMRLRVNATDATAVTGAAALSAPAGSGLNFGYLLYGGTNYVSNARLDEIGIWTRSLTDAEVTTLYASGAGITYPFP